MAGLTLTKGSNLSLTKTDPGLNKVLVGLGWDPRTTTGDAFDLDASALLLGADGKVRSSADFIFYNQPAAADGSVVHKGDNRSGDGEGDDPAKVAATLAKETIDGRVTAKDVREVFSDEVEMVSTRTSVGSIGILAHHQPLLGLLELLGDVGVARVDI